MWLRHRKSVAPLLIESEEAVASAKAELEQVQEQRRHIERQWRQVVEISTGIRSALDRNHFGESAQAAMLRKRTT